MLFSVEQVFVGRDKKRAPLKTPAWKASGFATKKGSLRSPRGRLVASLAKCEQSKTFYILTY